MPTVDPEHSVEPTLPQHDETIVPVRPGSRAGAQADRPWAVVPSAPTGRLRTPLTVLVAVVMLIAVAVVFVWLPERVEDERAARAPTAAAVEPAVAEPARPKLSPEEQAALKMQAEDLLAGLLTLQDKLTNLNVKDWASEDWQRYQQLSDTGDNAFLADDFSVAVGNYSDATALADALIERAVTAIEASFAAGEAALAAGNAELAIEQYDIVLTIEPEHPAALASRVRAERLPELLAVMQRADGERARGELDVARASYREALAIDPEWAAASAGIVEATRSLRNAEFERLLSSGLSQLGEEEFAAAEGQFRAALALRPDSREAQDGLAQAEEGAKLDQIALTEARALAFERRELWDQAIALYRSVLTTDETLLFAQTGLERADARAGLDAKLTNLIDNPTLLLEDTVLADTRQLLESAAAETQKGPRLDGQIAELGRLVELASTPIAVRLESDQLTEVTVYRAGTLGTFASRELALRPGTYTVIGSRDGYRDVRQTFTVRPGRNLPPISVVCVEPI